MRLLLYLLDIYMWIVIIRVVLSWINVNQANPIVGFIYQITEPVLEPIRRVIPPIAGGIDISPIVLFLLIAILKRILLGATL